MRSRNGSLIGTLRRRMTNSAQAKEKAEEKEKIREGDLPACSEGEEADASGRRRSRGGAERRTPRRSGRRTPRLQGAPAVAGGLGRVRRTSCAQRRRRGRAPERWRGRYRRVGASATASPAEDGDDERACERPSPAEPRGASGRRRGDESCPPACLEPTRGYGRRASARASRRRRLAPQEIASASATPSAPSQGRRIARPGRSRIHEVTSAIVP